MNTLPSKTTDLPPAMNGINLALLIGASVAGALLAIFILPAWLPGLKYSLDGVAPKAYWYMARASAMVAYALVWISMVLGVMMTNKLARIWPGGPVAYDLHQYASLLGLAFGLFHGLILLGDHFIGYSLAQVLVPFAGETYRPQWVGLGQVSFYLLAIVSLSFYIRRLIGPRQWRLIHILSFAAFFLALIHGIFTGADSGIAAIRWLYWTTGGSLLFLTLYRILVTAFPPTRSLDKIRA